MNNYFDDLPEKISIKEWKKIKLKLGSYGEFISSLLSTLEFYGLTFRCPKCKTYHSPDHKCFNCGFDHTAQD